MLAKIYIIYCNKLKLNEIWKRVVEFGAYVLINLWVGLPTIPINLNLGE